MAANKLVLVREYTNGSIDPKLFSSFVEHLGSTVYNGIYEPGHPKADANGFRQDVLALVRQLGLSTLRYPGGNYTSGYNWEDSVGPVEERPVRLDLAWRQKEPNTFGLHEFVNWSRQAGTDTIMTLNLGTRGIDDARNLLEYCNHPGGTSWSDRRIANGAKDPFNFRIWCLGNELDATWQIGHKTAGEYGRLAAETARVMRYYDPALQLIAVGSSGTHMPSYPEWDRETLMECYDDVDYIALHKYITKGPRTLEAFLASPADMDRQIREVIATADYVRAVKRSSKTLMLAFDEWNVSRELPPDYKPALWQVGPERAQYSYTFEEALVAASMMMSLVRYASRIKIACQAILVNVIPLIIAKAGGPAFPSGIFYPFAWIAKYAKGQVLHSRLVGEMYDSGEFGDVPVIDQVATWSEADGQLTVFALNRAGRPAPLEIDLVGFAPMQGRQTTWACPLHTCNSPEAPGALAATTETGLTPNAGKATATLPPYSFNVIRFAAQQ